MLVDWPTVRRGVANIKLPGKPEKSCHSKVVATCTVSFAQHTAQEESGAHTKILKSKPTSEAINSIDRTGMQSLTDGFAYKHDDYGLDE
jgi:hypothetical protein